MRSLESDSSLPHGMTSPRFLPDTLPAACPPSEHEVFDALRATLPAGWTVFSNVHWTNKSSRGKFCDGEADFVLYHPDFALLVLEVKGGGIEFNPDSGDWHTVSSDQQRHELKYSPFTQARSNMYAIIKLLLRHTGPRGLPLSWGYGVIFPTVVSLDGLVGQHPQAPPGLVAGRSDLPYLGEWCEGLARSWMKKGPDYFEDLGAMHLEQEHVAPAPVDSITGFLRDTLCPTVSLPTELCLRQGIGQENQKFLALSEAQRKVLSPLSRNRRLAIRGGAGTGKTLLALNKALAFARQGIPTLLTCFNRVLAESLLESARRDLKKSKDEWVLDDGFLTVKPLPDYVAELLHGDFSVEQDNATEFWQGLPEEFLLWRQQNALPPQHLIQAIVLDEGQDFGPAWWKAIPSLLSDPDDDYLWVFYDDNQAIYADGLGEEVEYFLPGAAQFDLAENFRNTQKIHAAFEPYCKGLEQSVLGPGGRTPETLDVHSGDSILEVVSQRVRRLVEEEGIPPDLITVLTPTRNQSDLFVAELGGFPTQSSGTIRKDAVVVETIHSFKGQESPVVILAEMHLAPEGQSDRLRYIGMSRAVHHLVLVEKQ